MIIAHLIRRFLSYTGEKKFDNLTEDKDNSPTSSISRHV